MIARRGYLAFFVRRLLGLSIIWGSFFFVSLLLGSSITVLLSQAIGLVILLFVGLFFFEYDSLPRGIRFQSGFRLDTEDASGVLNEGYEYGIRKFLWLTRITYSAEGISRTLPLEAFLVSAGDLKELD